MNFVMIATYEDPEWGTVYQRCHIDAGSGEIIPQDIKHYAETSYNLLCESVGKVIPIHQVHWAGWVPQGWGEFFGD